MSATDPNRPYAKLTVDIQFRRSRTNMPVARECYPLVFARQSGKPIKV